MMDEQHKEREDVMTLKEMAEMWARLEESWSAQWDGPSKAPGFAGATPRKLAKALFKLGREK